MKRFKNILVGADLSTREAPVSDQLTAPVAEAIARATWLAKKNSARLSFIYTLDESARQLSAETLMLLEESHNQRTVADHAVEVLATLADKARQHGISADSQVVFGKSWVELIRQVLRNEHDLVVVGTRELGPVKTMLLGSTGIKLLRKCPCPVWVTRPQTSEQLSSILVAHDLRPVGDLALALGASMAQFHIAQLHVLHAVEHPEFDSMLPTRVSAEKAAACRRRADEHIANQLKRYELSKAAHVEITKEPPHSAIASYVEQNSIELVTMGTIGRAGIAGVLTGNTAERLLPLIPCSVLAVKPEKFESPIRLE